MYTVEEADQAMEPFFQKQKEAEKKICCWMDSNVDLVYVWLQAAIDYSRICFKYDSGHGQTEQEYREEYVRWAKENTQLNCKIHEGELE